MMMNTTDRPTPSTAAPVTVVLTTYNDKLYLPHAIEAVLGQRHADFELLVVDDGSSDGCEAIYRGYAERDARVRFVRQANQGASSARNTGLRHARGEFVCFLDSDDLLHPDFLAVMVDAARASGADLVVCDSEVFPDGAQPRFDPPARAPGVVFDRAGALRGLLTGRIIPNVWGRLYRRAALDGIEFARDLVNGEDMDFSCRLLFRVDTLVCLNDALYGYRKRAGSVLSTPKPKLLEDRLTFCRRVREQLREHGVEAELATEWRAMAVQHLGFYGMKDLARSPAIDWAWFDAMKRALREEYGITRATLRQLPVSSRARKWVGIALGPAPLARLFLGYQHRQARRP